MPVYLETNALRKLTSYECKEHTYTSIFSIFELLSGITEKEFEVRRACLKRIRKQKIEIKGPMIDKLFANLIGISDDTQYNQFAYKMIKDVYHAALTSKNFSCFNDVTLRGTDANNKRVKRHALTWLKNWDDNISNIIHNINCCFESESKEYIKKLYANEGAKGLARHFWWKMYDARIDEKRLAHAESFIGVDKAEAVRQNADILFSTYNYKLFMTAQAVIFSKAFFINGNTQNHNNASDLLHLLYLSENDKFVSNDRIYQTISEACPDFNLITLNNEKNLADLI